MKNSAGTLPRVSLSHVSQFEDSASASLVAADDGAAPQATQPRVNEPGVDFEMAALLDIRPQPVAPERPSPRSSAESLLLRTLATSTMDTISAEKQDLHSQEEHQRLVKERRHTLGPMPVLTFSVTKINQRGRRQARLLRLSRHGIENVREKGAVASSIYEYTSVEKVVIDNVRQFSIHYNRGKHPYTYASEMTIQIVTEIRARANAAKERLKMSRFNARLYQLSLRSGQSGPMAPKAERVRQILAERERSGKGSSLHNQLGGSGSLGGAGVAGNDKLIVAIWKIFADPAAEESQALATVHKALSVRVISNVLNSLSSDQEDEDNIAHVVRSFLDGLRDLLLEKREGELKALLEGHAAEAAAQHAILTRCIEMTVENAVLPRYVSQLKKWFQEHCRAQDAEFAEARALLAGKAQDAMHVSPEFQSPSGYRSVAEDLCELDKADLPSDVIDVLLGCVRSLYREATLVSEAVLGADDFLPILIFAICRSNWKHPFALIAYAWALCDPQQLQSEFGYYLTVVEGALTWIVSQRNPAVETRGSK